MSRARCRTWSLAALDRESVYRLWFDPRTSRWEVQVAALETGTVDLRRSGASGRQAAAGRASGRRTAGDTSSPTVGGRADHG